VKKVTRSWDLEEEDVGLVESGPRLPNAHDLAENRRIFRTPRLTVQVTTLGIL